MVLSCVGEAAVVGAEFELGVVFCGVVDGAAAVVGDCVDGAAVLADAPVPIGAF